MIKKLPLLVCLLIMCSCCFAQKYSIHLLKNCQGEMRIVTYTSQTSMMHHFAFGMADIRNQKRIILSPSYKLDTAWFDSQIKKVKQLLPAGFIEDMSKGIGDMYDNTPDQPAIWFLQIFGREEKNGSFKAYAAIKTVFEGTDAHIDQVRANPRITNIQFVFDKKQLSDLEKLLKSSKKVE